MKYVALVLLAGSMLSAQTPSCSHLEQQYDDLVAKGAVVQEVAEQLNKCYQVQLAANTQIFVQQLRLWAATDQSMEAYREQQRRYKREPWRKEFWRR